MQESGEIELIIGDPSSQMEAERSGRSAILSGSHSNRNSTISGLEPKRSGGPHVPAPLLV